jgi:hypothetical protein
MPLTPQPVPLEPPPPAPGAEQVKDFWAYRESRALADSGQAVGKRAKAILANINAATLQAGRASESVLAASTASRACLRYHARKKKSNIVLQNLFRDTEIEASRAQESTIELRTAMENVMDILTFARESIGTTLQQLSEHEEQAYNQFRNHGWELFNLEQGEIPHEHPDERRQDNGEELHDQGQEPGDGGQQVEHGRGGRRRSGRLIKRARS